MTRTLTRALGATALAGAVAFAGSTAIGDLVDADRSAEIAAQIDTQKPRNVILIIGDGMDDSMITAARNYELGADGRFALDTLPFTGAMTTHGLKTGPGPDYPIAYVSDSAPTASAWSTGRKTVDSRVSQGPSTALEVAGQDYETVLEKYRTAGKRTGNVSTAEITDATPAAAASHINNRACQGPSNMATCPSALKANGGKGSIAEQLVDSRTDVILGGGASRFAQTLPGSTTTVSQYAQSTHGYRQVGDKAGLAGITSLGGGPVLGLFANGNMTPQYQPLVARPGGVGGASTTCQPAERGNQPTLSEMTAKAIELLDNEDGFFLQTESAMIDKQEHASDICGAIGDLAEIDRTVQVALDFQAENPDTLIIVTGDHAHSTQIVGGAGNGKQTATLRTADGDPLTVAYSTQDSGSAHTGSQIRVAAKGPQAANVNGVIDQTDLFGLMLGKVPADQPSAVLSVPATATRSQVRASGILVQSDVARADTARLTVEQDGKVLLTTGLETGAASTRIKVPKAVEGELVLTLTATGSGGEAVTTRKIFVTR